MLATVAALGSALLVALASVLQHRAGHSAGHSDARPSLRRVLRHPLWIVGATAGVAGFGLHVVALSSGALSVVQPLLVTGLLFALPLSVALDRRPIRVRDTVAAGAVVVGLATFQLTARPANGRAVADLAHLGWSTAAVLLISVTTGLVAIRSACHRAVWLGACSGVSYGLAAALMKTTIGSFASRGVEVLATWPPYAFVLVVVAAIAVNQLAFNAGSLAQSLPLITICDPLVSVAIGAVAFNETVAPSRLGFGGASLGFVLMSIGVTILSRRSSPSEARHGQPAAVAAA